MLPIVLVRVGACRMLAKKCRDRFAIILQIDGRMLLTSYTSYCKRPSTRLRSELDNDRDFVSALEHAATHFL